jgi:hypothetical protein
MVVQWLVVENDVVDGGDASKQKRTRREQRDVPAEKGILAMG